MKAAVRAQRVPVEPDGGPGGYSAVVTRRWRENNPDRSRWINRRNARARNRAVTWVRRNRPDVWRAIWAEVEAELAASEPTP
jgi:hypothetical protein